MAESVAEKVARLQRELKEAETKMEREMIEKMILDTVKSCLVEKDVVRHMAETGRRDARIRVDDNGDVTVTFKVDERGGHSGGGGARKQYDFPEAGATVKYNNEWYTLRKEGDKYTVHRGNTRIGMFYSSPTAAAQAAMGKDNKYPVNGVAFWKLAK